MNKIEKIRELLICLFQNDKANESELRNNYTKEEIIQAWKEQNEVLNDSIINDPSDEVRKSHNKFQYNYNLWFSEFIKTIKESQEVDQRIEKLKIKLLNSMYKDSVNLRQELLWTEVYSDLEKVGKIILKEIDLQLIKNQEFKNWYDVFMMDAKLIYLLRNGKDSFLDSLDEVEGENWIIRGNKNERK